jgi:hypothetical protein
MLPAITNLSVSAAQLRLVFWASLGIDFSLTNVSGSNDTHPSTHPNYSIDAVADASSSKLNSTENFTFSVRLIGRGWWSA